MIDKFLCKKVFTINCQFERGKTLIYSGEVTVMLEVIVY